MKRRKIARIKVTEKCNLSNLSNLFIYLIKKLLNSNQKTLLDEIVYSLQACPLVFLFINKLL